MVDLELHIEKAIKDITGNEALLEMLDTEAATEMLEWGKSMVVSLVKQVQDLDDTAAEIELDKRLKALRQFMRSVGNWAAGKYTDLADRIQLRAKLLGHYKVIFGRELSLPADEELDTVLNKVDDTGNTPHQLILNLKKLLLEPS